MRPRRWARDMWVSSSLLSSLLRMVDVLLRSSFAAGVPFLKHRAQRFRSLGADRVRSLPLLTAILPQLLDWALVEGSLVGGVYTRDWWIGACFVRLIAGFLLEASISALPEPGCGSRSLATAPHRDPAAAPRLGFGWRFAGWWGVYAGMVGWCLS